jgi:hypothetical protein
MRLLAIVSRDPALLSRCPEGWAAAIFHRPTREWCSSPSRELVLRGDVLVAKRGVTEPPLSRDGWVFSHGGGAPFARDALRRGISAKRLRDVRGANQSELLFAYLLTRLDEAGVTRSGSESVVDAVLRDATAALIADRVGALDFVLSNGALLYAHRFGPPLYLVRQRQPPAILIASEPLTDEPWVALDEGALVRCQTGEDTVVVALRGVEPVPAEPSSEPELPFTD